MHLKREKSGWGNSASWTKQKYCSFKAFALYIYIIYNKLKTNWFTWEEKKNPSHQIGQMPWISMKGCLATLEWVQKLD